jgi:hypothetical protein
MKRIESLIASLEPLRKPLEIHPLYTRMNSSEDLRIFMEHHVFAVWDFMSMLKALQNALTCTTTPWVPKGSGRVRYLINEIVTGEESDENQAGERMSHFEMYLSAMREVGASTDAILSLLKNLQSGDTVEECIVRVEPASVREFLSYTFHLVREGKAHKIASAFTFGREDLIPEMFIGILADLKGQEGLQAEQLLYYLQRHIEIDGDEHGHLSIEMVELLCGDDEEKWKEAEETAQKALVMRKKLWDGVVESINMPHELHEINT